MKFWCSSRALLPVLLLVACGKDPAAPYEDDTDPLTRTDEQLCRHWKGEHVDTSGPDWVAGKGGTCDLGTVPDAAQQNGVRRLNLYRWFVGLPAVIYDDLYQSQQQRCATMEASLGHLDHCNGQLMPNTCPTAACYSPDGATGASSSNLAEGTRLADSVDQYVQDDGGGVNFETAGHRRWDLDPALASTTFGFHPAEGGTPFSCMHVQHMLPRSQWPKVDYVAYPPPGPVPEDAAKGRFTFGTNVYRVGAQTQVNVAIDGGPEAVVPFSNAGGGIGTLATTIIYDPVANHPELTNGLFLDGRTIKIRITGLTKDGAAAEVSFETRFVKCK